jgi:drug/metabolite transporter (DMT)-like permease
VTDDRLYSAIGLRLLSALFFSIMNVGIKLAETHGAALGEILFFRQFGATLLVAAVVASGPGFASLKTKRFGAHVSRCVVGLSSMAFTFTALMMLPLAEATTIGFSMPIFATILGALVLGEATGWRRWSAVLAGFVGVVIVTGAGGSAIPPLGALSGLAAAVLTATVSILLRQIGRTEAAMTTVFWFSFLSLLPLGVVLAFTVRAHPPIVWVLLLGIGLVGGCAQLAMTGSLSRGAVSIVVPMDYSSLVWATAFGWLIFGTLPVTATWIGAPIIIASGLYIVWREHLRRREETRQAIAQGVS